MRFFVLISIFLLCDFCIAQTKSGLLEGKVFQQYIESEKISDIYFKESEYIHRIFPNALNNKVIYKFGKYIVKEDTVFLFLNNKKKKCRVKCKYHLNDSIELSLNDIITKESLPFVEISAFYDTVVYHFRTDFSGVIFIPKIMFDSINCNLVGYNDASVILNKNKLVPSKITIWMSWEIYEWEFPYLLIRDGYLEADHSDEKLRSKFYPKKR